MRRDLYKPVNVSGPEDRRRKLLADAKDRRRDFLAHARQLAQAVTEDAAMDLDGDAPISASTTDAPHLTSPMYNLPTATGARPSLSNELMSCELLSSAAPSDLSSSWSALLCPTGERCLLSAFRGTTVVRSALGAVLARFPSRLPGGSPSTSHAQHITLLDVIMAPRRTDEPIVLYVLDVMCWRGHPLYDCDITFRQFWVHSRLAEVGALTRDEALNPAQLVPLQWLPATADAMKNALGQSLQFACCGIALYHNDAPYIGGPTPLALWVPPEGAQALIETASQQENGDIAM